MLLIYVAVQTQCVQRRTESHTAVLLNVLLSQGTHNMYQDPKVFRPERFLPDGEYDRFDETERLYKFVPFIQVCVSVWVGGWGAGWE